MGGRRRPDKQFLGRVHRDAGRRPRSASTRNAGLRRFRGRDSGDRDRRDACPGARQRQRPLRLPRTAGRSANLFADMWGLRPALAKYGMTLSVIENSEVLGNVTGGVRKASNTTA